jgi:hypothetical protein
VILEHVERWSTIGIKRDELTVDHGFGGELFQPVRSSKALGEVLPVARKQLNLTVRLRAQRDSRRI